MGHCRPGRVRSLAASLLSRDGPSFRLLRDRLPQLTRERHGQGACPICQHGRQHDELTAAAVVPGSTALLSDNAHHPPRPQVRPPPQENLHRPPQDSRAYAGNARAGTSRGPANGRDLHGVQQQRDERSRRDIRYGRKHGRWRRLEGVCSKGRCKGRPANRTGPDTQKGQEAERLQVSLSAFCGAPLALQTHDIA